MMATRWEALAPIARFAPLLFCGDGDRLFGPWPGVGVVQQIGGHLVILHLVALVAIWEKRPHAERLKSGRLESSTEVEGVVGDEREEQVARVDPHAAEHAAPRIPGSRG
jgi:hypothetical protein